MNDHDSILGLAIIRQNRGISLEQISELTKISMRCLRAIEAGEFQKLPGGIYNTNYLRQYARAIDFDEAELLKYYHSKTGPVSSETDAGSGRKGNFGGFRPASSILRP